MSDKGRQFLKDAKAKRLDLRCDPAYSDFLDECIEKNPGFIMVFGREHLKEIFFEELDIQHG